MTDIVIKAEDLGKHYTTGHQAEKGRYVALRDVLAQNARNFALSLWRYREAISCFCDCVRLCYNGRKNVRISGGRYAFTLHSNSFRASAL